MYKLEFTLNAKNSIKKLEKSTQDRIHDKLLWLRDNCDVLNHKKLKGNYYENIYKLRFGDYRILYTLNKTKKEIIIELIGNRKDIYKV